MLVEIGPIVAPHGIRGHVKVRVPEPASSCLLKVKAVNVGNGETGRALGVSGARPGRGVVVVKLCGVDDRSAAEALRGAIVSVDEADMPGLPDGEYYLYELRGMSVVDESGTRGTVTALDSNNAQDLLVVTDAAGREHLVPFVKGVVVEVQRDRRVVKLQPMEGLFE
ncbi:MAG: 16S rRNA processing protein RimM [Deltaproteobacteria bacterium]|nr:16S rRNA processing protein RimM [Deltaproteobacteria bacterium]